MFCAALLACCAQVDWKLTRGKWRPKLLDYAKAHSEATVKAATIAAYEIMSSTQSVQADLKAATGSLTELKVSCQRTGLQVLSLPEGHCRSQGCGSQV